MCNGPGACVDANAPALGRAIALSNLQRLVQWHRTFIFDDLIGYPSDPLICFCLLSCGLICLGRAELASLLERSICTLYHIGDPGGRLGGTEEWALLLGVQRFNKKINGEDRTILNLMPTYNVYWLRKAKPIGYILVE